MPMTSKVMQSGCGDGCDDGSDDGFELTAWDTGDGSSCVIDGALVGAEVNG
jgi:hypothetical protein